jgi:hypothetical protein
MFLQTSNLALEIIAFPPGLELGAKPTKSGELHDWDFTAFRMNVEHLSTLFTMRKQRKPAKEHSRFQIFQSA